MSVREWYRWERNVKNVVERVSVLGVEGPGERNMVCSD